MFNNNIMEKYNFSTTLKKKLLLFALTSIAQWYQYFSRLFSQNALMMNFENCQKLNIKLFLWQSILKATIYMNSSPDADFCWECWLLLGIRIILPTQQAPAVVAFLPRVGRRVPTAMEAPLTKRAPLWQRFGFGLVWFFYPFTVNQSMQKNEMPTELVLCPWTNYPIPYYFLLIFKN